MKKQLLLSTLLITSLVAYSSQAVELSTDYRSIKYITKLPHEIESTYATGLEHYRVIPQIFEGLVSSDSNGKIVPAIAESWQLSDNGKLITFHLKNDVFWSDGAPIVAKNFVDAYQMIINPAADENKRPSYLFYDLVGAREVLSEEIPLDGLGVYAKGNKTLEFHLKRPLSYLPSLLLNPGYFPVPSHVIDQHAKKWSALENLVTNGAYIPVSMNEDQLILKKNDKYWDADNVYFEEVELINVDGIEGLKLFLSGQADVMDISNMDINNNIDIFSKSENYQVTKVHAPSTSYVGMNHNYPHLSDVRVRRALSLSLDRKILAKVSGVSSDVAYGFSSDAKSIGWKRYIPDVFIELDQTEREQLAKSLLSEAGFGPENPLELTLTHFSGLLTKYTVRAIAHQWGKLGIKVNFRPIQSNEHMYDLINQRDFEVALMIWYADYDDPQNFFSAHGIDDNSSLVNWRHSEYRDLFRDLELEMDSSKRVALATQMEEIIADQVPIIPVLTSNMITMSVKGIEFSSPGYFNLFSLKNMRAFDKK